MTLLPYDPYRTLVNNMRKEFDRFFSNLPVDIDSDYSFGKFAVDVYETENEIVATCDLPGLEKKDDVNIEIDNNILNISGVLNRSYEVQENQMYRKERYTGRFQRSITLPSPVSQEGVSASYRNGVLEVRMPKLKIENKKKIDIKFE